MKQIYEKKIYEKKLQKQKLHKKKRRNTINNKSGDGGNTNPTLTSKLMWIICIFQMKMAIYNFLNAL